MYLSLCSLQLFTASKDETVRLWDCKTKACISEVPVGGYVDSILLEGGFLFVGIHVQGVQPSPSLIKVRPIPPARKYPRGHRILMLCSHVAHLYVPTRFSSCLAGTTALQLGDDEKHSRGIDQHHMFGALDNRGS